MKFQKVDYSGLKEKATQTKKEALDFIEILKENNIHNFITSSCYSNGETFYFKFLDKDFAEVMKVRISDHGVTSNRRVTGGEFLGFRNNLQRILEVAKSWNEEYTAEWGADNDYTL
ncbi:hypothetical protein [Mesonia mobilis]|uniref:hypothetical protein n=1 Tax=Mesonia mobilis TaxID=369791 RepID=UPI0024B97450|nr:hypothetical protein [Mesonia mobilis]